MEISPVGVSHRLVRTTTNISPGEGASLTATANAAYHVPSTERTQSLWRRALSAAPAGADSSFFDQTGGVRHRLISVDPPGRAERPYNKNLSIAVADRGLI